jgi:hypothetical protein
MSYRSTREIIELEPLNSTITIERIAAECIQMAQSRHALVRCRYNGVDLEFEAESDVVERVQFYDAQKVAAPANA